MAGFLLSNVVFQKGSLWHGMWKIQSDNKGGGTGQSLPVAVAFGSRADTWEVIYFKNMRGRNGICRIECGILQGHSSRLEQGGVMWEQLTCEKL